MQKPALSPKIKPKTHTSPQNHPDVSTETWVTDCTDYMGNTFFGLGWLISTASCGDKRLIFNRFYLPFSMVYLPQRIVTIPQ